MTIKSMANEELDLSVLYEGRLRALESATTLHADAALLLARNRYSTSFFIANIATEELGKYALMVNASCLLAQGEIKWSVFWKNFRSHKAKTHALLILESLHDFVCGIASEFPERSLYKDYANLQDEVKMKSLYCDFSIGKGFIAPTSIIKKEICEIANDLLTERLHMVNSFERQIASNFTVEQMRSISLKALKY